MKLAEQYNNMHENKIPQEQLKRVEIRKDKRPTHVEPEAKKLGIDAKDVIGWFATKANSAAGYAIFKPTEDEKKEFGDDCFRIVNNNHGVAGIIKLNLKSGTFSFLDSEAYENESSVKYKTATPYNRLVIDDNKEAFDVFNIV